MSDGKMDVGDKEKSAELKQKIFSELLPELKKHQIRIYSIAFTTESDQGLLQEIADATDGRYALAASDDVLHKVFTKMFEQSKEPNMLPLTENQFVVDKSISEITIIANKKDDASQIFLETPTGKRINSSFKSKALKWFVSPGFDMITLSKPEEGTWKILFSDDDNKAYIVANIKLRSQFKYDAGISNEATIETWFIKDDKPVINNELLNTLELNLEIENPEGQVEQLTLEQQADSGIFKAKFTPSMNGIYAATVMAKSKTFQRQQYFSFRAAIPEKPAIESEPEPAIEELPAATEPETAEPVAEEQPVIEQEETAEEDNLLNDILLFIIINVVIVFVGVNIYFISNILKARTPKDRKEAKE